jgi:endo-1,3(4)-beta-glucanase
MTAVSSLSNVWNFCEHNAPTHLADMFTDRQVPPIAEEHRRLILSAASEESREDLDTKSYIDNFNASGQSFDRHAQLCWTLWRYDLDGEILGVCLRKLKFAFGRFAMNYQKYPLVYDSTCWPGHG